MISTRVSRQQKLSGLTAFAILAITFAGAPGARAQETVLYSFGSEASDGVLPYAGVAFGSAGNLYGTTAFGGGTGCFGSGCGIVFKLTPQAGGGWAETMLHNFNDAEKDGHQPEASLAIDGAGNLYGTTSNGGAPGCGIVFELSPQSGGSWTYAVLHAFDGSGTDGCAPLANVILDGSGNLYGTTLIGGTHGLGTAFELSPSVGGHWTEKLLHAFGNGTDGQYPTAALVFDGAGNLYGATESGGEANVDDAGTVFELVPQTDGSWRQQLIAKFALDTSGPQAPAGTLVFDAAGNLYGTSIGGGSFSSGTVFEVSPKTGGGWNTTILHDFEENVIGEGWQPTAGVVLDDLGNIYGATPYGGSSSQPGGMVFKLSQSGVSWTETILYTFGSHSDDGRIPLGGVILDNAGNIYGTTVHGGAFKRGVIFQVTP